LKSHSQIFKEIVGTESSAAGNHQRRQNSRFVARGRDRVMNSIRIFCTRRWFDQWERQAHIVLAFPATGQVNGNLATGQVNENIQRLLVKRTDMSTVPAYLLCFSIYFICSI
uniref:Tick transposon n=1 Tax=Ascaris lumbricoides TaxID=6252 RepID=A0A0M3IA16_ASCLU